MKNSKLSFTFGEIISVIVRITFFTLSGYLTWLLFTDGAAIFIDLESTESPILDIIIAGNITFQIILILGTLLELMMGGFYTSNGIRFIFGERGRDWLHDFFTKERSISLKRSNKEESPTLDPDHIRAIAERIVQADRGSATEETFLEELGEIYVKQIQRMVRENYKK